MLQRIVELEPTSEETHRRLMALWAQSGNRSAALTQFERCCQLLADELGVNPADETVALYRQIQSQAVGPPPSAPLPAFFATPQAQIVRSAPLVARAAELQQLDQVLDQAMAGQGAVFLICGDAGQGKTALANEFARRAQQANANLLVVTGNCNAQAGVGDPYLPFCELLELLTGEVEPRLLAGAMTRDHALRLWRTAPVAVQTLVDVAPDLVDSLLPAPPLLQRTALFAPQANALTGQLNSLVQRKQAAAGTPQPRQEQLFSQVAKLLQRLARQQPLLLLIDDLQWADNGSIQLLFHLARQLGGQRILILGLLRANEVLLGRNGERHPLEPVINELKRTFGPIELDLSQRMGRAFVDALLDREPNGLDEAFRTMLYRQTEGHPLFTVELLRGMQERGDLHRDSDGQWMVGEKLDWESLPARVEAVIAERIGRLSTPLQRLLQVASIEGEFFTAEVIAQVLGVSEQETMHQLVELADRRHQLVRAHGIQRLEGQRISLYRFGHVLFQKYLERQLDVVERTALHETVGDTLERLFRTHPDRLSEVASQLALHFEAAQLVEKSIFYLHQAAERAIRLSASVEALSFLQKALQLLERQPETAARWHTELEIRLRLGTALLAVRSHGGYELRANNERAYHLAQQYGDTSQQIAAMWGVRSHYSSHSQNRNALAIDWEFLKLVERLNSPELLVEAHRNIGFSLIHLGELTLGKKHCEEGWRYYESSQSTSAIHYGRDTGMSCLNYLAKSVWMLGYPEQAQKYQDQSVALAQKLSHPMTLAYAMNAAIQLAQHQGDLLGMADALAILIPISEQYKFAQWIACYHHFQGWLSVKQGQVAEGIAQLQRGFTLADGIGFGWNRCYFFGLFADAYRTATLTQEGLAILEQALTVESENDDQYASSELYRLKGELLLLSHNDTQTDCKQTAVEFNFQQALTIARRQQAKSLELRAATSLARLWQAQGKIDDAYQLLAPVYNWFTEGFDTRDLQEAKALLDELRRLCYTPSG